MKKLVAVMFVLCLMISVALGQTDAATGTSTDDATMVRLRVAPLILNIPNVDVFIDGEVTNFGFGEEGLPCCGFTYYMYLPPGTYSVAIAPAGRGIERAKLGLVDVTVEAGHRYTFAVVGQLKDEQWTHLVIDETAALQEVRTDPSQTIMILVNNLAGTETLNFAHDGQGPQNIPYRGFVAAPVPTGQVEQLAITTDVGVIYEGPFVASDFEPGIDYIGSFTGRFPGAEDIDFRYVQGPVANSDLNALAFLQGFSGRGVLSEHEQRPVSFDTFIGAVEKAGLIEVLESTNPYWLLAPTDEAFADVPQDRLEAIMADPEALADLLRNHIVEGYFPDLPRPPTTMLGTTLEGVQWQELYLLPNGSHVSSLSTVLLPPDKACIAAQIAQINTPPRPLADKVVGMWLFDEGQGDTASDASVHNHHGTFVNAAWAEGRFGSAAQIIPGRNYIEVETTEVLSPAEEMTITAWVYLEALPDLEEEFPNRRILEAATYNPTELEYGGAGNHYGLHFQWGSFIFRPGPSAQPDRVAIDQSESIEPGQWQHVAGVYSGDHVRLYINGELRSEVTANCMELVQPENNRLFIGTKAPQAPTGDWWDGLIDEVAIFDVALTEEEVGIVMQGLEAMQTE